MIDFSFAAADPDYYEPIEAGPDDDPYVPSRPPAGWKRHDSGVWTMRVPTAGEVGDQGWEVPVSSSISKGEGVPEKVGGLRSGLAVPCQEQGREGVVLHD